MFDQKTATGRPTDPLPLLPRLLLFAALLVGGLELSLRAFSPNGALGTPSPGSRMLTVFLRPLWARYLPVRAWCIANPVLATVLGLVLLALVVVLTRYWILIWNNQLKARLTGTFLQTETSTFPTQPFELLPQVKARFAEHTFAGMEMVRGVFGWKSRPFSISLRQRSTHIHVLGKTGSGKTQSVLFPQVLQDALDGKGVLVMDAKGSDENIKTMKAIAALAKREHQLKVFALPAWNQPQLFSHTYNMVYVRPATPTDRGGDPVAVAERVFAIMPLGDNEYYNTQAQVMFSNVIKALHGLRDPQGNGYVFNLRDIAIVLKGTAGVGNYGLARSWVLQNTTDREAAVEINTQVANLAKDATKAFSGIVGAVDKFLSPLVNAYEPDIIFEDVLQGNGIVYVQLPSNLFKLQAPTIGQVMLMDVQQEGSLRQVHRSSRNQTPFSVTIDEFYNFADISIVDSLNKLRDANLHFTLAHQSIADLELVSKEFATAVWDNTRTKFILNQDNPALCELISKSVGTHQIIEKTVRQQQGALFTSLTTGDGSTKLVETFRIHPNAIKSLASCGQGYCYFGSDIVPLSFAMLPPFQADYELKRNDQQASTRGLDLGKRFPEVRGGPVPSAASTDVDASS